MQCQERSLGPILNDQESCFREVLQINNDITYHQRNIQILLTKVFQTTKNLALPIMESMFNTRPKNYNLQNCQEFVTEKKRTVKNDIETLSDYDANILIASKTL